MRKYEELEEMRRQGRGKWKGEEQEREGVGVKGGKEE